jgi:hypothetical protein
MVSVNAAVVAIGDTTNLKAENIPRMIYLAHVNNSYIGEYTGHRNSSTLCTCMAINVEINDFPSVFH